MIKCIFDSIKQKSTHLNMLSLCLMLGACGYFESEQTTLNKAKKLFDDNQFNESIVFAKKVLQSNPQSCDARIILGQNQLAKYSLLDAQESLSKAKNQNCKTVPLFHLLVKNFIYKNQLKEAKDLYTDEYFAFATNDPESIQLKGDLYFLQRDIEGAREQYEKYYSLTKNEAINCLDQVKLAAIKNSIQEIIQQSLKCESLFAEDKNFDFDQSRYLRALAQLNAKEEDSAIATLNTIIENYANKKDPNIKIQSEFILLKLHLAKRHVDDAAKMANALLEYIASPEIYHAKGLKAEKDNRPDLAEQNFLNALKLNPRFTPALLELANLKYKEGNIEQAKYYTGKADAISGKSTFSNQLDEMLAIKSLREGDFDSIISKLPNNKNTENVRSQYILALAYAKKGDSTNAWKVYKDIEKNIASTEKSELLKAKIHADLGNYSEAESIYKKYAKASTAFAVVGLTQVYMQQKKFADAEMLLKEVFNKSKDKYSPVILLIELYSTAGQREKIFSLLDQLIKSEPNKYQYKSLLAKVYYKYGMYEKVIAVTDDILAKNINDEESKVLKANAYLQMGNNGAAKDVFSQIVNKQPKNAYAHLMLAFIANKESNKELALIELNKSLEADPRYVAAFYAKIDLLLDMKQDKEALKFAQSAPKVFNDKQTDYLILGHAYRKLGDTRNAYLNYQEAIRNGNNDIKVAILNYELSSSVNGKETAVKELTQFIDKYNSLENIFYAGNYFMAQQDYDLAEKYYLSYISKNKSNPAVFNNLAWVALEKNKKPDAITYASSAYSLAPNSPEIMDTLGYALLVSGDYDKAGSYLSGAYQKLSNNPSVIYHLALYYYHTNQSEKSKALLLEIGDTQFAEKDDAKNLLSTISHR